MTESVTIESTIEQVLIQTAARGAGVPVGGADGDWLVKFGAADFSTTWLARHASNVPYTPGGTLAAVNVQAAIQEIETDYLAAIGSVAGSLAAFDAQVDQANIAYVNVGNVFTANQTFQSDAPVIGIVAAVGNSQLYIDGPVGTVRDLRFLTSGVRRWMFRADSGAETGSDAGSQFVIRACTDAGGLGPQVIQALRTGEVGIGTTLPTIGLAQQTVFVGAASRIGQIIKLAAAATADGLQVQDSTGGGVFKVAKTGELTGGSDTANPHYKLDNSANLYLSQSIAATNGARIFGYDTSIDGSAGGLALFSKNTAIALTMGSLTAAPSIIFRSGAANVAQTIKLDAAQTADGWQLHSSAAAVLASIAADGSINSVGLAAQLLGTGSSHTAIFNAKSAAGIPVRIRGFAAQVASLLELQKSDGAVLVKMEETTGPTSGLRRGEITVFGSGSNTGGLLRVRRPGTVVFDLDADTGIASLNSAVSARIEPLTAADIGLIIRGKAAQVGDGWQQQNSASTVLNRFTATGYFLGTMGASFSSGNDTVSLSYNDIGISMGSAGRLWFRPAGFGAADASIGRVGVGQIQAFGSLGIGVAPVFPLHVHAASAAYIHLTNTNSGVTSTDGFTVGYNDAGGILNVREALSLLMSTGNTTRVTLDAAGLFGIGITPTAQLHVQVGAAGTVGQIIKMAAAATADPWQIKDSADTALIKAAWGGGSLHLVVGGGGDLKFQGGSLPRWDSGGTMQLTVGAAGAAAAPPATPEKYFKVRDNLGATYVVPGYLAA